MGVGKQLNNELASWGVMAIVLIVIMIVLGQLDPVAQRLATDNGTSSTNQTMQTFLSDSITGLSEPANWVAIFVIALVGFGIIMFVKRKK
jgi:LPXTG-motif cell wall-anchored protein